MNEQTWMEHMAAAEKTLYHVACSLLSSESERQDALSETVTRCWAHRDRLRNEQFFTTWSVRILINVCHSMQRVSRRLAPLEQAPEPAGECEELRNLPLRLALEALPEKLRLVTVMYYLEGFSVSEVSRALGVPAGTVKARLHQARKKLRVQLDDQKGGDAHD
ncbi:MAG: RNA polymerase sigma factor [Aristaeellaceae bacterium]